MNKKLNWTIFGGMILIIIAVGVAMSSRFSGPKIPAKYDSLAICLKDKGAVFYGAWWCSHCKAQKEFFGKSAKLLPYVECSTPDGNSQLQICKDAKIEGYPTWIFADGSKLSGEIRPEDLAEKTGCSILNTEDAEVAETTETSESTETKIPIE